MKRIILSLMVLNLIVSAAYANDNTQKSSMTVTKTKLVDQHLKKNIKKQVKLNPKDSNAYVDLGNYFFDNNNFKKAYTHYQKAINLDPKNDRAYANLSMYYVNDQKYDFAIENARKALDLNPNNAFAYFSLADAYSYKGQQDQAIEFYHMSIKLNHPRAHWVNNQIGNAYHFKNQYKQAIEYYKKALEIDPDYTMARANLLVVEQKLKDLGDKEEETKPSIKPMQE